MLYNKSRVIHQAYKLADIIALGISMLLSAWFLSEQVDHYPIEEFIALRVSVGNLLLLALLIATYLWILNKFKLYDPAQLKLIATKELLTLTKAIGINVLLLAAAGNLLDLYLLSPPFLLTFWPTAIVTTYLLRYAVHHLLKRVNLGDHNRRSVVILGQSNTAARYARLFSCSQGMGCKLLGFVNDSGDAPPGSSHVGTYAELPQLMHELVIDEIVVTIPINEFTPAIRDIIHSAEARGITLRFPLLETLQTIVPRNALWRTQCSRYVANEKGASLPELVISSGYDLCWQFLIKRGMDISLSGLLLIILSPLMVLIALLIKLDSPGPALFVQQRHGYHGRPFRLYKFRTMVVDAESMLEELRAKYNEMDGAAFKMKNDPRVTRIGRYLRKTSLDELPQLFNVLRGDMSLVGPRPLSAADYRLVTNISHLRRFSVLPGLTCYWQISGRNLLSFEEWMELDLKYVDNFRLLEDVKILLATIPAVLKGDGAR